MTGPTQPEPLIDDKELAEVRLKRDKFHGEWNYEIHPRIAESGKVIS